MKEKISTVKNPLTVIAIFAGTAEISGTAILPLLQVQSQQTYIWFLMLFPFILIVFFFLTLNWNHKVLYAPSDFTNEDNFVNILKKPTIQETLTYIKSDLLDTETEKEVEVDAGKQKVVSENTKSVSTSKIKREKDASIVRDINRQRMQDAQMAELLVLNKLEIELNTPIQREMMIKIGNNKVIFDGVIQTGSRLTGIEVKYMRTINTFSSHMWDNLSNRFELLYQSLNESQKKSFSIIFAVVTDDKSNELNSAIVNRLNNFSFPIQIRIYDFDELRNEFANE